jgi:NADH-quinone oxidoreductase subunit C
MSSYANATRTQSRHESTWFWVDAVNWRDCAQWLNAQGFTRCEWVTATHLGDDLFAVTLAVANLDVSEQMIVQTQVSSTIDSLSDIYPSAQFHEREIRQLLGLDFENLSNVEPAFNADFAGYPLRRDFALPERISTPWPGQVDPEKAARRRPTLAPGVRQEWLP